VRCQNAGRGSRVMSLQLADALKRWLHALGHPPSEVSLLLVNDARMRALNFVWRKKDQPTDVLSFPNEAPLVLGVANQLRILGDIVISTETARRVAKVLGHSWSDEMHLYCVHGLLHLLGFDHEGSVARARAMRRKEAELLGRDGLIARSE
jgi:probable rRNA maturation factor